MSRNRCDAEPMERPAQPEHKEENRGVREGVDDDGRRPRPTGETAPTARWLELYQRRFDDQFRRGADLGFAAAPHRPRRQRARARTRRTTSSATASADRPSTTIRS